MVRRGSDEQQEFLRLLRQARAEAGLTQRQVAAKLQRSQSFVHKAESGDQRLDMFELRKLSKIYGKPPAYFFGEEPASANRRR